MSEFQGVELSYFAIEGTFLTNCNSHQIPKEVHDEVVIINYKRAIRAHKRNLFSEELIYLEEPEDMEKEQYEDDHLNGFSREMLKQLKAIYNKNESITAGNLVQIEGGAAAELFASEDSVNKHQIPLLARIGDQASVTVDIFAFCS